MVVFRYLLARIFKNVLFVLFLVCFFSVLLDFVHKSWGYLEKYNPSIQALTTFYIFWLPMIVQQLLPLAFTFGATFVVIGFSRSNELSAMFALGMTYRSLLLPFLTAGCLLAGVDYCLTEYIVPYSQIKSKHIERFVIRKKTHGLLEESSQWIKVGSRIFTYRDYDAVRRYFERPKVIEVSDDFKIQSILEAESALYLPVTDQWLFSQVVTETFDQNRTIISRYETATKTLGLPIKTQYLQTEARKPAEMTARELVEKISYMESTGQNVVQLRFYQQTRYVFRLAILLLGLAGLLFGYRFGRIFPIYLGVFISGGICLGFVASHSLFKIFTFNGWLNPIFASWLPVLILAILLGQRFVKISKV